MFTSRVHGWSERKKKRGCRAREFGGEGTRTRAAAGEFSFGLRMLIWAIGSDFFFFFFVVSVLQRFTAVI